MPEWSADMGQSNPAFSRQTSQVSAPSGHSNGVSPATWLGYQMLPRPHAGPSVCGLHD